MNKIVNQINLNNVFIKIIYGDITEEKVDAIVNAANSELKHGGGVAETIAKKGGPTIQEESNEYVKKHGFIKTGNVAVTGGGKLNCKYIIHAVGPIWKDGTNNEEILLYSAVYNSLTKADELGLKSIALPAISAGIFGYPIEKAVKMYFAAVYDFICHSSKSLKEIRFVVYDEKLLEYFLKEFDIQ
ncbi:MAG: macro domain-containing protein [Defluviitoga tunisiensis]|jgi:O-acetyl-ADP-ribose deacetylase (regulator of RNase III)|uniref:Appr-1-p processing domain-containing protein n=1 Tax=Defluviitoga tunisiensis TaxID=1006576 RepID=A0A0C7NNA2_DEFTU|nr:macro domain-containing protein [Defluviitoga tunisiensis]MDD3600784.1 macro domain-containing protein [Defluviitoga tunisiensis]MDY0379580.1 macro domain-containing protein [Defluviitoga tunisiensis]CEP77397.1 appr-1-p processing domain-containing protein [Defluviitoga tunisiensis]HHV00861.1 macro domain-containing protein [Defluviitoga tunisiensis]HOB55494.1 macro domain-containing protein [Defluviitoga tunisiensis]